MCGSEPTSPLPLRYNRNFLMLWCAYGISAMGDHLSEVAILKTKNILDQSVDATPTTARMTFMFFLPFLFIGPFAGVLADRFPRRGLMIGADLARFGVMLAFGALLQATASWGTWGSFVPMLVTGAFAAMFSPARSALLPTIIHPDQLARANGMISGLGIIGTMASTMLGGLLAKHFEPAVAFNIDALTFAASAACLFAIRAPQLSSRTTQDRNKPPLDDFLAGLRYARAHRHVIELLMIAGLVWFCGPVVNSIVPAVVRDIYGGDFGSIGVFRAMLGLGFVFGAIGITILGDALRPEIAISWGFMGIGVGILVFALSCFLPFSPQTLGKIGGAGIVLAGANAMAVMASYSSLLQRTVPDRYRGRVFGVADLCTTIALLTATGLLGIPQWLRIDRWVGFILLAVAVVVFVAGVLTFLIRMKRSPMGIEVGFWVNAVQFFGRFWWRLRRVGPCTVPRVGPVIVTANHRCTADPLFIITSSPGRLISFMVAQEYTKWPIFSYFLRAGCTIPVTRSGQDTGAIKQAIRHLRAGNPLGIFIEGGIVPPGETPEPRDGVAMLAMKTGAKVVPAYISGVIYRDNVVRGLLTRHKARVRFGKPVDISDLGDDTGDREKMHQATLRIHAAVKALAPPDDVYVGDEPKRKRRRQQAAADAKQTESAT